MSKPFSMRVLLGLFFLWSALLHAQSDYSYSYLPKQVYENQVFPITIMEKNSHKEVANFTFDRHSATQPLFTSPLIIKNGNDTFYTFYFKATHYQIRIPKLFIDTAEAQTSLPTHTIHTASLEAPKHYAKVLANHLNIKNYQVSNYDTQSHMVTLMVEALEANLEEIAIPQTQESGIENIQRENAKVTAEIYVVLPRKQKILTLCYFNTLKKQFISLKIPVELSDASVTTQSDLNPKVDAFTRLKEYALRTFIVFFFIMFVWKRDIFYLVLAVVLLITLMTFYVPHKKICVEQGAPLYILPTSTSSIGTRVENQMEASLLGDRGNYYKIEYKKGIIGWIKNENLCKN